MKKYPSTEVESRAVSLVKELFIGKYGEITTNISENDKTPLTDGSIFYKNSRFYVQVKGSEKNKSNSVDKKYVQFAGNNDLIFFHCSKVWDKPIIMYKILIPEEIIQGSAYEKIQKSYALDFTEFEYLNFKKELDDLIIKRYKYKTVNDLTEFFKQIKNGTFTLKSNHKRGKFNKKSKISQMKALTENNIGIKYFLEFASDNLYLEHKAQKEEKVIGNKKIEYTILQDLDGNIKLEIGENYIQYIKPLKDISGELKISFSFFDSNNSTNPVEIENFILLLEGLKQMPDKKVEKYIKKVESEFNDYKDFFEWYEFGNFEQYVQSLSLDRNQYIMSLLDFYLENKKNTYDKNSLIFKNYIYNSKIKFLFVIGDKEKNPLVDFSTCTFSIHDNNSNFKDSYLNFIGIFHYLKDPMNAFEYINLDIKQTFINYFSNKNLVPDNNRSKKEFFSDSAKSFILLLAIFFYIYSKDHEIYDFIEHELCTSIENDINFINYIQLKRHANYELNIDEMKRLEILKTNNDPEIKLCSLILLEEKGQIEQFNKLELARKKEFMKYPIYRLYKKN